MNEETTFDEAKRSQSEKEEKDVSRFIDDST